MINKRQVRLNDEGQGRLHDDWRGAGEGRDSQGA